MPQKFDFSIHEAVIYLLNRERSGLTAEELSETIRKENICINSDGSYPSPTQIKARISSKNYKTIFNTIDGKIFHNPIEEKRLMRLTYNTNNWEEPIAHKWTESKRDTDAAFENKWGFGFEEWLFNPLFYQDGYQYGFIRGVLFIRNLFTTIREVYLFTINQVTGERFIVGVIKNVEPISVFSPELEIAEVILKRNLPMMKKHLKRTGADIEGLQRLNHCTVRFRPEDVFLFEDMIPSPELNSREFMRFRPYKIEGDLDIFLAKKIPKDAFNFQEGRSKRGGSKTRTSKGGTKSVNDLHAQIIDYLQVFIKTAKNPFPGISSIEKCRFGWHVADIVLKHEDKTFTIFEIKTTSNLRRNIREAIGQLLDYACWYPNIQVRRLIIVSPESLSKLTQKYFTRLCQTLSIELHYWQFEKTSGEFKFIKEV